MIKVIHKTFDILELIAKDNTTPLLLSQIADELKMNHGTCANIIKTIVNRGYLEQVGYKKGYRLGSKFYYLTTNFSYKQELVNAAKDVMVKLTNTIKENTLLAVINGNKRLILYDVPSEQDLQVKTSPEKDLYETSSGRLLLAHMSQKERESFLIQFGLPSTQVWKEASTAEGFEESLSKIKKQGLAKQVTAHHIVGLAAPITLNKVVVASLGVYIPEIRFKAQNKKFIEGELRTAAGLISNNLDQNLIK